MEGSVLRQKPGCALVLIGFMGAGKSTVARGLSVDALDSDALVESQAGMSVETIFEVHGEQHFRELEERVVLDALDRAGTGEGGGVLSLGGGALGSERVRAALKSHTTVLLDVSLEKAWERVRHSNRPLASDEAAFRRLFLDREPLYRDCADVVVPADGPPALRDALGAIAQLENAPSGTKLLWARTASGHYPVYTGSGLLGSFSADIPGRGVVITDNNLSDLLARRVAQDRDLLTFPAGEANKTVSTCEGLWQRLADLAITRDDHVIAVGGGVVGDIAGFVAATYQRGIPVVHWPTTLVAQVDSAYGGKTGVDLPQGKNYVGSYHQPAAVLTDVAVLETLPTAERAAGMAEVIKTALIAGGDLWNAVASGRQPDLTVITGCALTKLRIVAADERDAGARQLLNLGHTVGHAIETATDYARLRHGEAVGLGLLAALRLSGAEALREQVFELLRGNDLPTSVKDVDPNRVHELVSADKKARGDGSIPFVLCSTPGNATFGNKVDDSSLAAAIAEVVG